MVIVKLTLLLFGHVPFETKVIAYVFNVLELKFISPVPVLTKTRPEGVALNVPVYPPLITGIGFVPLIQ